MPVVRVGNPPVSGQPVGHASDIPSALFVGSGPHGVDTGARFTYVAGHQSQVHQRQDAVSGQLWLDVVQSVDQRASLGFTVQAGRLGYIRGIDLGCFRNLIQVQGAECVLESSRAFTVLGQPIVFLESLVDDRFQQSAQQQLLSAGRRAQPDVGVAGQFDLSGIDHNQLGVFSGRPFDRHTDHVMFLGDVAAEDQDAAGLL